MGIHKIPILIPPTLYIELEDCLDKPDDAPEKPLAAFMYKSFSAARRAKRELEMFGKIPYSSVKNGKRVEETAPLTALNNRKSLPDISEKWKLPDIAKPKVVEHKMGDRAYEAIKYFCNLASFQANRSNAHLPAKDRPKAYSIQQILSETFMDAARREVLRVSEEEMQAEHDEIYKDEPKTKPGGSRT